MASTLHFAPNPLCAVYSSVVVAITFLTSVGWSKKAEPKISDVIISKKIVFIADLHQTTDFCQRIQLD